MKLLYDIALSHLGIPYVWGGKNPLVGLDCSGLVHCILSSVGMGPESPTSADAMYRYWLTKGAEKNEPQLGALAFYGTESHVHHVAFCLDSARMIEAAHGDETCNSKAVAALKGAYVKVSPIHRLLDCLSILTPDYSVVGLSRD